MADTIHLTNHPGCVDGTPWCRATVCQTTEGSTYNPNEATCEACRLAVATYAAAIVAEVFCKEIAVAISLSTDRALYAHGIIHTPRIMTEIGRNAAQGLIGELGRLSEPSEEITVDKRTAKD